MMEFYLFFFYFYFVLQKVIFHFSVEAEAVCPNDRQYNVNCRNIERLLLALQQCRNITYCLLFSYLTEFFSNVLLVARVFELYI